MRAVLLSLFVFAAACGSSNQGKGTTPAAYGAGDQGSDVTCHEVTDTGSMFSHTECTKKQDAKEEHDDAERYLQRPSQNTPPKTGAR